MKRQSHPILTGALILTAAGFISRTLGFFYRVYLSHLIGAEGMGLYQMISPVSGVCFALCCGPVQTAISRFVAGSVSENGGLENRIRNGRRYFAAGLLLALGLSLALAAFLYTQAGWLAPAVLGDARTADLLRLLALSLPVTAVHSAVNGYYYGKQKTQVPSLSQLAEQLVRVGFVYLLAGWLLAQGRKLTVVLAALGLVAGELASLGVSLLALRVTFFRESLLRSESPWRSEEEGSALPGTAGSASPALGRALRGIVLLAAPLCANRLILGLLQSLEAIQIPLRLEMSGLSASEALGVYGTLTGMALPFILFPSALTNSLSVMLLPSVAEAQSLQNTRKIRRTAELSIRCSLYLGILCAAVFSTWGHAMGALFFQSSQAGSCIAILGWLCPFLYLSTTSSSILNGMGKTGATFLQHLAGLGLRLAFVFALIPRYGIAACLWGMLASELLVAGLHLVTLHRLVALAPSALYGLLRPMAAAALAIWISRRLPFLPGLPGLIAGCASMAGLYLAFLLATRKRR